MDYAGKIKSTISNIKKFTAITDKPLSKARSNSTAKKSEYITPDYSRNEEGLLKGKSYSFNPFVIIKYAKVDPFISAARNKKVNKVMSGGYYIEADDDEGKAQAELFEEWAMTAGGNSDEDESVNFTRVLRKLVDSAVVGDVFYLYWRGNEAGASVADGGASQMKVLDWEYMHINRDKDTGVIDTFTERLDGNKVKTFLSDEISFSTYYGEGTKAYGRPLIASVLHASARKLYAEGFAASMFIHQRPKFMVSITGSEDFYEETKKMVVESRRNPEADLFLRKKIGQDASTVEFSELTKAKDFPYEKFIDNSRVEILVGMGVPPASVYLPGVSTGWDGDIQLHEFDEDINCLREFFERFVNETVMPRLGFDRISFKFSKTNKRDELREVQIVRGLSDILTVNQRLAKLGYPPIEGGDVISPISVGFGGGDGGNPNSDGGREHEVSTSYGGMRMYDVRLKNPNYTRKGFGGAISISKELENPNPKKTKASSKDLRLLRRIDVQSKRFSKELLGILTGMIDKIILDLDTSGLVRKQPKNPKKNLDKIDELRNEAVIRAKEVAARNTEEVYAKTVQDVSFDLGVADKILVDTEALDFLKTMNIDLVEGALSEAAARAKTAIRIGIESGESVREIAKRMEDVKGGVAKTYKNRLNTIARTEVSRTVNEGRLTAYERSNVVEKVQALVAGDPDGLCSAQLEGSPWSYGKVVSLSESRGMIPVHVNCGCTWTTVVE